MGDPRSAAAMLLVALTGACSEKPAPGTASTKGADEAAAVVPQGADASDPLLRALFERWRADAPHLTRVEPVLRASLGEGDTRDYSLVLEGGYCYRFLAVSEASIVDLDLLLFDPNGVLMARDGTRDGRPGLALRDSFCPGYHGAYRLRAKLADGAGEHAIGVYRISEAGS